MIVDSSGQIAPETVHDHGRVSGGRAAGWEAWTRVGWIGLEGLWGSYGAWRWEGTEFGSGVNLEGTRGRVGGEEIVAGGGWMRGEGGAVDEGSRIRGSRL